MYGNFQHELHAGKIICSGVSKIADFRHVDMEGKTGLVFPADDAIGRLGYTTEIGLVKNSEDGVTLPRFLHRRVAGNMQPLTGGDADMIHESSMAVNAREKQIQKNFRKRFPKSSILDI